MDDFISESLLEMHYHHALIEYYRSLFAGRQVRLLKPSPQREVWLGFDQGWTVTELSDLELYTSLKTAIRTGSTEIEKFYFGHFLQFKRVEQVSRRSKRMPRGYAIPYYRSHLSLKQSPQSGISQHETLMRLKDVRNAVVYYACCMLFCQEDIWEPVTLDSLRLVDLATAPQGWTTNQSHFLAFTEPNDPRPSWCSEPVEGKAFSFNELVQMQVLPNLMGGSEMLEVIQESARVLSSGYAEWGPGLRWTVRLPECFSLFEIT